MTSYNDPTVKILASGLDDWVSLAEARSLVQVAHGDLDDRALRSETLAVVGRLLADGLVRPGTLSDRFSAWDLGDDALQRIAEGWEDADASDWLYSVWLENTEPGNAVARSIPDRR
ncbi:hypothetical protein [Actinomycetospora sp. CA-084318]|uniref:hypothetical protein n=1 Tax=Actinomycetospora sp. CA-084318 TaxID=3239892 RepID=UPI003D97204D